MATDFNTLHQKLLENVQRYQTKATQYQEGMRKLGVALGKQIPGSGGFISISRSPNSEGGETGLSQNFTEGWSNRAWEKESFYIGLIFHWGKRDGSNIYLKVWQKVRFSPLVKILEEPIFWLQDGAPDLKVDEAAEKIAQRLEEWVENLKGADIQAIATGNIEI